MEFFFIFWFLCGVAAGIIEGRKGSGCLGFAIGFLLGPIGIVIALVMKGDREICPYCKEYINRNASRCPHCQMFIVKTRSTDNINTKECPECAESVKLEAIKCEYCGHAFYRQCLVEPTPTEVEHIATSNDPLPEQKSSDVSPNNPPPLNLTKRCPYCAELIADNSLQCEFCQSNLQDLKPLRKVANEINGKQEHLLSLIGWKVILAIIIGIMIVLLAIDIWQRQDRLSSNVTEQNNTTAKNGTTDTQSLPNNGLDNGTARPTVADPSEYILPDSGSRELTNSDVEGLTRRELKLARNEIFARHGFDFGDKPKVRWLKEYFMSKSWYQPNKSYQSELNDIEKHNAGLIVAQEERIWVTGKYVIHDSSTRYLTEEDVKNLSKSALALARNEIRARNGYVFPDKPDSIAFKEYFESQPWYIPNPYYNSPFNEYEKANVDLIRQFERGDASITSSKSRDPIRPSIDGEWESNSGNAFVIRTYGEQLEVVFKGKWRDKTYQGKWISNNQFEFKSNELCTAIISDKNTIKVSAGDNLYMWSRKISVTSH